MASGNPKPTALAFNDCINQQDLEGFSELMTENQPFIDSENEVCTGKDVIIQSWARFFKAYPDYENHFLADRFFPCPSGEVFLGIISREEYSRISGKPRLCLVQETTGRRVNHGKPLFSKSIQCI